MKSTLRSLTACALLLVATVGVARGAELDPEQFVELHPALSHDQEVGTVKDLMNQDPQARNYAMKMVLDNPQNYPPPALYALAVNLFIDGRKDEAVKWFQAARLRAHYDALRCPDSSARQAVQVIEDAWATPILRYEFTHIEAWTQGVEDAVKWDATHPHSYDNTWLWAEGIGVIDANTPTRAQWEQVAQKNRDAMLASFMATRKRVIELGSADFPKDGRDQYPSNTRHR